MLINSLWALLGQGARIALQALLFLVLARGLGAGEFGSYMTIIACAQILFPLSGMGTHNTMIMRVARRPRLLNMYLGTPLLMTLLLGFSLAFVAAVCFFLFYSHPGFVTILSVFLTELVAFRLLDVVTHAWQGMENLRRYALAYSTLSLARLLLASCLWLGGGLRLHYWGVANLLLTTAVSLFMFYQLFSALQLKWRTMRFFRSELDKGVYFSLSGIGQALYGNLDKILISRLLGSEAVGAYAVAQRMVQMAFLPVLALFQAAYPKYFQAGSRGMWAALQYSRKMAPLLLVYGVVAALANYLLAPYIPWIFGKQYVPAVKILQILALLPLVQVAHYLLGEAITGCGQQRARSWLQISVGCLSGVVLYLWLYYAGLSGVAWAALLVELLLLLVYAGFISLRAKEWQLSSCQ